MWAVDRRPSAASVSYRRRGRRCISAMTSSSAAADGLFGSAVPVRSLKFDLELSSAG